MEIQRYGEPMFLPQTYRALVVIDPPRNIDINESTANNEGVWLNTDNGECYVLEVDDIKCFDPNYKLYVGTCCLFDRDNDTIDDIEGDVYLLVRYDGKIAHQAELWLENE